MSIQIRTSIKDNIGPDLKKKMAAVKNLLPVLEAAGMQLVSITKRSFNDASLRVQTWPVKRDGTPATLKREGALWQSIRIVNLSNTSVTIGSDRRYAAIHQMGGVIKPVTAKALKFFAGGKWWTCKKVTIPARPFFPFIGTQMAPFAREKVRKTMENKLTALMGK